MYIWGNYQLDVYCAYATSKPACIYDVYRRYQKHSKKIRKPDNSNSKHIFFYSCVINCDYNQGGLFPVAQMNTEVTIQTPYNFG